MMACVGCAFAFSMFTTPVLAQVNDITSIEKAEDALIGTAWTGNIDNLPMNIYLLDKRRLAFKIGDDNAQIYSWILDGNGINLTVTFNKTVLGLQGVLTGDVMSGTSKTMGIPKKSWELMKESTASPDLLKLIAANSISNLPKKVNPQDFTGLFTMKIPSKANGSETKTEINVECDPASSCTLMIGKDQTEIFNYVSEIRRTNFNEAGTALKYARERKEKAKQEAPYLTELLDSEAEIETCIDLRSKASNDNSEPSEPGYILLCKPTVQLGKRKTVLLMGTRLSNCGAAFCRFDITPLSKSN